MSGTIVRALCTAVAILSAASAVAGPKRIALIVGNSNYTRPGATIRAAERDGADIARALRDLDFDVEHVPDAKEDDFRKALLRYDAKLAENEEAETVFYYSGHGANDSSHNFLIPVDVDQVDEAGFVTHTINTEDIYKIYRQRRPRLGLIFLDACRTSPFPGGKIKRGLLEQPPTAPENTVTAFAAQQGQPVPTDSDGVHSDYTKAILLYIGTPGLALADCFSKVGKWVSVNSDRFQQPYVSTLQRVPFFFRDPAFVEIDSDSADNDIVISVAGGTYVRNVDGPRKRLRLEPGDNVLTVTAVNFPTRDSKLEREGWSYSARLRPSKGTSPLFVLAASEHSASRERFGTSFVTERVVLSVDEKSGVVTAGAREPAVWEDGFSLIGSAPGDELYQAIRWAVTARGVLLFDDASPARADTARVRRETAAAHRRATQGHPSHGSPELDRDAHAPHVTAADLMTNATDRDVELVVDRLRREAAPLAHTSLVWLCRDATQRAMLRRYFDAGEWGRVRAFFRKTQLHAAEVKPQLNALPKEDVAVAVEDACHASS
jgi:uncharacterized caspase-like protein